MKKQTLVKPSHLGHRKRIRQRLTTTGTEAFLDHELLEVLLTYSIARKDTKPTAWALLKHFGSLSGVLDADQAALTDVAGIGPHTAQLFTLLRELFKRYLLAQVKSNVQIRTPQQVLDYCKASLAGKKEEFLEVIFLSTRNTIISIQVIARGEIDKVSASPRKIVEWALKEKASALILVHNHPSGDATPSAEDIDLTLKVIQAARVFDISVHDHIIISKGMHYSLKAAGYI